MTPSSRLRRSDWRLNTSLLPSATASRPTGLAENSELSGNQLRRGRGIVAVPDTKQGILLADGGSGEAEVPAASVGTKLVQTRAPVEQGVQRRDVPFMSGSPWSRQYGRAR